MVSQNVRRDNKEIKMTVVSRVFYCGLMTVLLVSGCANSYKPAMPQESGPTATTNTPAAAPDFEFRNISGGSLEQTEEILHNSLLGHLIVNGDYPYSLPVNYIYENKSIYFPLRKNEEQKICDIVARDNRVCFAVDNYNHERWHSIHIFGTVKVFELTKDWLQKYIETFGETGFTYDKDPNNMRFVRLIPELVTVRLNYDSPVWFLGKLKLTAEGKLKPAMEIPAPGGPDATTFTGQVEFVGLPATVADTVLRLAHSGRINTLGVDYPYSVPVNSAFPKGKIYFHSNKNGLKVMNIAKNQNVSFDIDWFWNGQEWLTVTVEGKARLLPPDEVMDAMQYFGKFIDSPDGLIPADFKPEPGKQIGHDDGSGQMMQRVAVVEITPERVITRSVPIPEQWLSKMPPELSR